MNELEFYEKVKNWDFSLINYTEENLTDWDLYEVLQSIAKSTDKILDLGTGGGEKVLKFFPECEEILATDFSEEMIKTANENLKKSNKKNIIFRQMDNLNMDTPNNYFDIVVARHTCIDAKQIYNTLKIGGKLIIRGVDKLDCWSLKLLFGKGQAYNDTKPISVVDYENIIKAGFKNVELVPIHVREYYKTKEDLIALLLKTPILEEFSEIEEKKNLIDYKLLDKYITENTTEKGILLIRRYYGITAIKKYSEERNMVKVKICANRSIEDAKMCLEANADIIGVLVGQEHESVDFVDKYKAKEITEFVNGRCNVSLVTHLTNADEIIELTKFIGNDIIQLHSDILESEVEKISTVLPNVKLVRLIHISQDGEIVTDYKKMKYADYYLLDSFNLKTNQVGGTGLVHNWNKSNELIKLLNKPTFLAGGLTPVNVVDAIKISQPYGVDVNSGCKNKNGIKDADKVKAFVFNAKKVE